MPINSACRRCWCRMNRCFRICSSTSRVYRQPPYPPNLRQCHPHSTALHPLPTAWTVRSPPLRVRFVSSLPPMDPGSNNSAESEPPAVEDFVHVQEPVIYSVYEGDSGIDPVSGDGAPEAVLSSSNVLEDATAGGAEVTQESAREAVTVEASGSNEEAVWQRKALPVEISKSVVHLECETTGGGICDVYLVGTAHVSQESCREVQAVIDYLKPQVVFLELCASRIAILKPPTSLQVPTLREMVDTWKKNDSNALGILYGWFLAKIASTLEVFPGAEFRVAFEEAMSYGAKVILGDRPVNITLRRTWGRMTLWHKTKFFYYMLSQTLFLPSAEDLDKLLKEIDNSDMVTLLIQEMSKEFPTLMETIVYERDLYMSSKLFDVASNHSSVVAVVGKGHLSGIKKHWKQPIEVDQLLEIPTRSGLSTTKILASLGVAGVAIISAIYIFKR